MDALSDVLQVVRLGGAVYLHGEFTAPWSVASRSNAELCATFLPQCERVMSYHLVTHGSCWAQLAGDPSSAMPVNAGELLVVPQGEEHIMASSLDIEPVSSAPIMSQHLNTSPGEMLRLTYGGGGDSSRLLCGFIACDETLSNPLIAMLPRMFKVDMRNDPRSAWIESSLQFAAAEAADWRPGSSIVLGKLSELLFVEAVRRCIDSMPTASEGWLAGVRDRFVGRALALMHAQPAYAWTVDELARAVGLSRSALAQRFAELTGQPPMHYLTRWRLQLAAKQLTSADKPLIAVAAQVGYDSEAAFNRAFKREFGMPPSSWRKAQKKNEEETAPAA
jgi:AraC family transcriptional regulator, alkane utilization regulator